MTESSSGRPNALRRRSIEIARRWRELSPVVQGLLSWIPGALIFFRAQFTSGFDKIGGDNGDGRLAVVLHEHWLEVFRGHVSWTSPPFFFPVKGTFGYSDTYLVNQVFYTPLRLAGLDQFLALEWTLVLMSVVGFVGMFVLLRRVIGSGWLVAFMLSSTFAFANNLFIKASHAQLYSVYWLPLVVLLAVRATRSESRGRQAAWGALCGSMVGLILFSTYYVGWFFVFTVTLFGLFVVVARVVTRRGREVVSALATRSVMLIGMAGGLAVTLIPFLVLYLPVLRSNGGRRYQDAMFYAPSAREVVNLGANNYLWGSLVRHFLDAGRLLNSETSLAVTPVVLVSALALGVASWSLRHRDGVGTLAGSGAAGAATLLIVTLLPLRFGIGSLWRLPWTLAPGASGIRAIDRIQIVAGPLACLTIGIGLTVVARAGLWQGRRRSWMCAVVGGLLLLIAVEQINVGDNSFVDRSNETVALARAPFAPAECRVFYVIDTSYPQRFGYEQSVDALLIAQRSGIPTVNGYSGQYPPGYLLSDPTVPDYLRQVRAWAGAHDVEDGLCSYDIGAEVWTPGPPPR